MPHEPSEIGADSVTAGRPRNPNARGHFSLPPLKAIHQSAPHAPPYSLPTIPEDGGNFNVFVTTPFNPAAGDYPEQSESDDVIPDSNAGRPRNSFRNKIIAAFSITAGSVAVAFFLINPIALSIYSLTGIFTAAVLGTASLMFLGIKIIDKLTIFRTQRVGTNSELTQSFASHLENFGSMGETPAQPNPLRDLGGHSKPNTPDTSPPYTYGPVIARATANSENSKMPPYRSVSFAPPHNACIRVIAFHTCDKPYDIDYSRAKLLSYKTLRFKNML